MRPVVLIKFAWKAVRDSKLRAILTVIGLLIGPAMIVGIVSATEGYSNSITSEFSSTGVDNLYLTPLNGTHLTESTVSLIQAMDGVKTAVPYYELSGTVTAGTTKISGISLIAINLTALEEIFPGLSVYQGKTPSSGDLEQAVVGYDVAYTNTSNAHNLSIDEVMSVEYQSGGFFSVQGGGGFGGSASSGPPTSSGSSSSSGTQSFVVSEILDSYGSSLSLDPDQSVFISLEEGMTLSKKDYYSSIIVVAKSNSQVSSVEKELENYFGNSTVRITTASELEKTLSSVSSSLGNILLAVGSVSLLVAFVGIMTTMFTTVYERRKEIGILKSIGYSSKNVLYIFLTEASLMGFIGGVLGAGVGVILSFVVIRVFSGSSGQGIGGMGLFGGGTSTAAQIMPVITPELLLLAIALATVLGAIGGLIPAWRASRMSPVDAVRTY